MVKRYDYETAKTAPADDFDSYSSGPSKLFDITCTVGSVYSGGNVSPRVAAFQMIAEHSEGRSATYYFPGEDGRIIAVTIDEPAAPQS